MRMHQWPTIQPIRRNHDQRINEKGIAEHQRAIYLLTSVVETHRAQRRLLSCIWASRERKVRALVPDHQAWHNIIQGKMWGRVIWLQARNKENWSCLANHFSGCSDARRIDKEPVRQEERPDLHSLKTDSENSLGGPDKQRWRRWQYYLVNSLY